MLIRFLRYESSEERLGSWSGGPEANIQVPRVGDDILIVMNVPDDDEEGNTYNAVFEVKKVIWVGLNMVDVILRERAMA